MDTSEEQYRRTLEEARRAGEQDGRDAASWYFDGSETLDTLRAIATGIADCDPLIMDTIPANPLSGEWAGGTTEGDILGWLGTTFADEAADDYLQAYCDSYSEAAQSKVEQTCDQLLAAFAIRVYVARAREWPDGTLTLQVVDSLDSLSPDTLHPIDEEQIAAGQVYSYFLGLVAGERMYPAPGRDRIARITVDVDRELYEWAREDDEGRGTLGRKLGG